MEVQCNARDKALAGKKEQAGLQAEQTYQNMQLPGGFPAWQPQRVRALIGVSGVYNCFDLADHFNRRGLYRKLFDNIMSVNGQPNLKLFSPTYCIKASSSNLVHCPLASTRQGWDVPQQASSMLNGTSTHITLICLIAVCEPSARITVLLRMVCKGWVVCRAIPSWL